MAGPQVVDRLGKRQMEGYGPPLGGPIGRSSSSSTAWLAAVALAAVCRRHGITLVSRLKVNAARWTIARPCRRRVGGGGKPKLGRGQPSSPRGALRGSDAAVGAGRQVAWYGGRPKTRCE